MLSTKERVAYLDYLRVFATVAVVVLHVAAQGWSTTDTTSIDWNIRNVYDSVVRWCVPIFIMISGALFLNRDISIRKIYLKYILRLLVAYCIWSLCYNTYITLWLKIEKSMGQFIVDTIQGHFHMWYIPMIVGVYMCIPIVNHLLKSQETMKYILIVIAVFTFVLPQVALLTEDFIGGGVGELVRVSIDIFSNLNISMMGYLFYFIVGYQLANTDLTRRNKNIISMIGTIGFLSTILLTMAATLSKGEACSTYYDNISVNVAFEAIAVFVWVKYSDFKENKWISALSKYSFGVYLTHPLVMLICDRFGFNSLVCVSWISIPLYSIVVLIASYGISAVFHKIPFVNKWIV